MFCPYCGQPVEPGCNYCGTCGNQLGGAAQNFSIEPPKPVPQRRNRNPVMLALIAMLGVCLVVISVLLSVVLQQRNEDVQMELPETMPPSSETTTLPTQPEEQTEPSSEELTEAPTERPTETTAQPSTQPSTEAETEPPTGEKVQMRSDEQYKLNLFLSNFSESGFGDYDGSSPETPDFNRLILIFSWYNLNKHSDLRFSQNYDAILSFEQINARWERFFGTSLQEPTAGTVIEGPYQQKVSYYDGYFYTPWGDGDSHAEFTVARELYDNGDGSYTVCFDVYTAEDYTNGGDHLTDDSYYSLNPDTVGSKNVSYQYAGRAVLRPYTEGSSTYYQLLTYSVDA